MKLGLRDKTVLVTAGSKGIGLATAQGFHGCGAKVAICSRDADNVAKAAETMPGCLALTGDVTQPDHIDRIVAATVEKFRASLFGDDGSCYSLESDESIKLPVGSYTLGQFSLTLKPSEGQPYSFSFSHSGRIGDQQWYEVDKDGEVNIALFGELSLMFSSPNSASVGDQIDVRPTVKTEDGLYVTFSSKGTPDAFGQTPQNPGDFTLTDAGERQIGTANSGFA